MSTDNNGDFRDRLHRLGQAGASHEPLLPDDAAAASIRTHAVNARRREKIARSSIATVCVMTLVAGGFGAYQLVNKPPIPIAGPAAPHGGSEDPALDPGPDGTVPDDSVLMTECGTDYVVPQSSSDLVLVSEGHTDKDGNPLSTGGKRWETSLVGYGTTIPLLLKNTSSKKTFEGGSTGYAWVVVTKNGKVVSAGSGMPEPYMSFNLKPGETSPITLTGSQPCPGVDYMTGDFEVTAILDYSLGESPLPSGIAVGGPWKIRVGSTPAPIMPSAEVLGCGAVLSDLVESVSPNKLTASLEATGSNTQLTLELEKPRAVSSMADLQLALVKDGAVITTTPAVQDITESLATTGTMTSTMAGGKIGTEDCHGDPLEPGKYEVIAVSVAKDASDASKLVHIVSNRVPLTLK